MPELPIPITLVRWTGNDAVERLRSFLFGGHYVGHRPPRGIDPEFVSYWVPLNVPHTAGPPVVAHLLDLLRFYERPDLLSHVSRFLTKQESTTRDVTRSLYAVTTIGDFGTLEQIRAAAVYFAEYLLPHPAAMEVFPLVLDTAEALALAVDMGAVGRRLQAAIDAASQVPDRKGAAGIPYRKYTGYARNLYPAAQQRAQARQRLLATDPTQRLNELLGIYLGESPFASPSMEILAGRLLRSYARQGGQTAVVAAFSKVIDVTASSQSPQDRKDFLIQRSADAIQYFQAKLTFPQEAIVSKIEFAPANFLCDDLTPPRIP